MKSTPKKERMHEESATVLRGGDRRKEMAHFFLFGANNKRSPAFSRIDHYDELIACKLAATVQFALISYKRSTMPSFLDDSKIELRPSTGRNSASPSIG